MKTVATAFSFIALLTLLACSNTDQFTGQWKGISEHATDTLTIKKTGNNEYTVQLMGNPAQEAILNDGKLEFGKPEFKIDLSYNQATGHLMLASQAFAQPLEFIKL